MGDIGVTLAKYLSHTHQAQLGHTSRSSANQPCSHGMAAIAFPRVRSLVKNMTTMAMNNYLFQSFVSSSCIVFSCTCYDIFTNIVYAMYILSLAGLACRIRVCTITSLILWIDTSVNSWLIACKKCMSHSVNLLTMLPG